MRKATRGNRLVKTLKVSRETLLRMTAEDMEKVAGAYPTKPTQCPSPGSEACCDTL